MPVKKRQPGVIGRKGIWYKVKEKIKRNLKETGNFKYSCEAVGLYEDEVREAMENNDNLARELNKARAEGVLNILKALRIHGKKFWMAYSWILERNLPEEFGQRPKSVKAVKQAPVSINLKIGGLQKISGKSMKEIRDGNIEEAEYTEVKKK